MARIKNKPSSVIDVSKQWHINSDEKFISGPGDDQWSSKNFTIDELNLFNSLDTMDLSGTTTPDSVLGVSDMYHPVYPNPFSLQDDQRIYFLFNNSFNGEVILKMVYVDASLKALFKGTIRVNATASIYPNISVSHLVALKPTLTVGKFRIYYTLSSEAHPHFYKSWGNVEATE